MPRNQFQRMVFAFLTVLITVHAYVFYSLYVVNGQTLMNISGESSVVGAIRAQGGVYMFGRMDNVINCQGIKIAPEEIEEVAGKYGQVLDCACVPMEDKLSGQVPKLYVVVQDKELFQIKDLLSFLRQSIDGNKMPKKVEVIEEIPRTSNGKIHRARLVTGKP